MDAVSGTGTMRPAQARIAVAAIFLVNGTAFASWVPHIPTVQQKLALSPGVLGLALLAIAIGGALPSAEWLPMLGAGAAVVPVALYAGVRLSRRLGPARIIRAIHGLLIASGAALLLRAFG